MANTSKNDKGHARLLAGGWTWNGDFYEMSQGSYKGLKVALRIRRSIAQFGKWVVAVADEDTGDTLTNVAVFDDLNLAATAVLEV